MTCRVDPTDGGLIVFGRGTVSSCSSLDESPESLDTECLSSINRGAMAVCFGLTGHVVAFELEAIRGVDKSKGDSGSDSRIFLLPSIRFLHTN